MLRSGWFLRRYDPSKPADIVIKKDGDYAVAVDKSGRVIVKSTDHASVIQTALDSLTSNRTWKEKVVLIGDFTVDTSINVSSYTIIELHGKIKIADGVTITGGIFTISNQNDVEIRGGILDCNRDNTPDGGIHTNQVAIYVGKSSRIIIENVHARNGYYMGFSLYGVQDSIIRNNYLEDFWEEYIDLDHGLDATPTEGNIVEGNIIVAKTTAPRTTYGIFLDGSSLYPPCRNNVIANNIIYGNNVLSYGIAVTKTQAYGNIVKGNIVTGAEIGIMIESPNNSVIGNTLILNRKYGVLIYQGNTNTLVAYNTFINNSQDADVAYYALMVRGWYCHIIGNKFINDDNISTKRQLGIKEDTYYGDVDYNYIVDNDVQGVPTPYTRRILKAGTNTIVKNNRGYPTEANGVATLTGDGTTTDFLIGSHGLAPSITDPSTVVVSCTPANSDAIANAPITCYLSDEDADGNYESIRVKFASAPASGTSPKVAWRAEYIG